MRTETRTFPDDGTIPNHPDLPLLIVRGTGASDARDPAAWFKAKLLGNGWGATWRWGIYDFHHFHSTQHEVLGVASGRATVMFGGAGGEAFDLHPGDMVIIPAGVGHCCLGCTADFQVVGAYPRGEKPDLLEGPANGETRKRIAMVPLPESDPLSGNCGPIVDHWHRLPERE